MSKFEIYRDLLTRAKRLEADARRMTGRPRIERFLEAAELRAQADWLCGRIDDAEYAEQQSDQVDARRALDDIEGAETRKAEAARTPVAGDDEIPY